MSQAKLTLPMRGGDFDYLPPVDERTLQKAFAAAEASFREPDPVIRKQLEAQALSLWTLAHTARRAAMYRGRR